ncbi:hypothetical protein ACIRSU_11115 [Streptomyces sp. NPDC101160]|uniref:hypothetical protein n=1 Tax=Streptomyces sp. NPDC101160 TaxID=3366118 RepID=UPI0037F825C5
MECTPFPSDLLDAQTSWITVYEALARPCPTRATALRRHLIRLSAQVYFHPYWARPAAGGRPELLLAARAQHHRQEVTAA